MKRLATTALALSLLTMSLAMANDRHDDRRWDRSNSTGHQRDSRDWDHGREGRHYRDEHRRDWRDYSRHDDSHFNRDWRYDRRYADPRYERDWGYDRREGHSRYGRDWRYERFHDNDYRRSWGYRNNYWYPGYRVPRAYFTRPYVVENYGYYRLRTPPRGCHWVRMDNDLVLAALATGVVLDVLYNYF